MKKIFTLLFISITYVCSGQNTWIRKINLSDMSPYANSDSLTGIKWIDIGPDGGIYVIANYGQSNSQVMNKISSSGDSILMGANAGYHGGITGSFTNTVRATSDSGCIMTFNFWGQSTYFHVDGEIQKYSKTGVLEWAHDFPGIMQTSQAENEAYDAIEAGNYYYAYVGDSVVKFNHSGGIVSFDSSCNFPVRTTQNGDIIFRHPANGLSRIDTSGNVIWSNTVSGSCGCASEFMITDGFSKIDLADGSTVWTKTYPFPVSGFDQTPDGGFIASYGIAPTNLSSSCWSNCSTPGFIFRVDANGDTLWTHTYNFPYYGLPRIKYHPSGNIITGGAFLFTNHMHTYFDRDYSSFVTALDSNGHGALETTSIIWPGDANNNKYISFVDDALYVGLAMGDTGPARDSVYGFYMDCDYSDIAYDWTLSFPNGANHKHADYDGNGVIDTGDVNHYVNCPFIPFAIPNWKFQ